MSAVERLLAQDANLVRERFYSGKNPLHVAASQGRVEILGLLLKRGAELDAEGYPPEAGGWKSGRTALEVAIWYGHSEVMERLLQAGADPNHLGRVDGSALHVAFTYGRESMVARLLDAGANPFLVNTNRYPPPTPIELAITRGTGTLVPRMLAGKGNTAVTPKAREFLAVHGPTLLGAAVRRGQSEAVEALLDAGVPATGATADRSLLQALALAEADARLDQGFVADRWLRIRRLLEQHGAESDVFAATGLGDVERARRFSRMQTGVAETRDAEGQTPLLWAVRTDRLPLTAFWLEAGARPSATNQAGQTALHIAAGRGLVEHIRLLLASQAPIEARDTNGLTALDAAIRSNQTAAIRRLLLNHAPGNVGGRSVSTALHRAITTGDTNLLAKALAGAVDLNARDESGFTPLQLAIRNGELRLALQLLDAGAHVDAPDASGNTVLHLVFTFPVTHIASRPPPTWLRRLRDDPRVKRFLPAADEPSPSSVVEATRFLLVHGADPSVTNAAGVTPAELVTQGFMQLFEDDWPTLLQLLSQHGGDLDAADQSGDTMLHRAAREVTNTEDDLAALIEGGADVHAENRLGRTPLHAAVESIGAWPGPLPGILNAKPNLNARDHEGLTPLHILVMSEETAFLSEAASALLEAGADPRLIDNQGRTPLHVLLTPRQRAADVAGTAALLIRAGADRNVADTHGRTPLHYLASLANGAAVHLRTTLETLDTPELQLNGQDDGGNTPSHLAVRSGNYEIFNLLARRGADLDLTNHAGDTARMLASQTQDPFFKAFLRLPAGQDIFRAAVEGDVATVRRLLDAAPRLANQTNHLGRTPLAVAAEKGNTNVLPLLLAKGAAWDARSAALLGRGDVLADLLARHPAPLTNLSAGKALLHLAAEAGHTSCARVILDAGGDLHLVDGRGVSALGCALLKGHPTMADYLRSRGAAENVFDAAYLGDGDRFAALLAATPALARAQDARGATPGHVAVALGREACLDLALARGLPADSATRDGLTMVHIAAAWNHTNAIATLLARGAPTEPFDRIGYTPLHYAASCGAAEAAALLLDHGAGLDTPTRIPPRLGAGHFGLPPRQTAYHIAAARWEPTVLSLLARRGSPVNATNSAGQTAAVLAEQAAGAAPHSVGADPYFLRLASGLPLSLLPGPPPGTSDRHGLQQATLELLRELGANKTLPIRAPPHPP